MSRVRIDKTTSKFGVGTCDRCHRNGRPNMTTLFYHVDNVMIVPIFTRAYMHDLLCASCILSDNEVKSLLLARALRGRS